MKPSCWYLFFGVLLLYGCSKQQEEQSTNVPAGPEAQINNQADGSSDLSSTGDEALDTDMDSPASTDAMPPDDDPMST
jgi:PBP1b-binding outer membrane lipoprotein LpoB